MIQIHCDHPELKDEFQRQLSANPYLDAFEIINDEDTLMIFGGDHRDKFFIIETWYDIRHAHNLSAVE